MIRRVLPLLFVGCLPAVNEGLPISDTKTAILVLDIDDPEDAVVIDLESPRSYSLADGMHLVGLYAQTPAELNVEPGSLSVSRTSDALSRPFPRPQAVHELVDFDTWAETSSRTLDDLFIPGTTIGECLAVEGRCFDGKCACRNVNR